MAYKLYLFLIVLFSFLVSFPAIASDWVEVVSNKNLTIYVDKQSVKGDMNSRKFWEKIVFKERQYTQSVSGNYYNMTKEYVEADCSNNINKLHEITYYLGDEDVAHGVFPKPSIIRVAPDTVAEPVEKFICSFKPTTNDAPMH